MGRRQKKSNRSKLVLVIFFAVLVFFGGSLVSSRNKIVDINPRDIDYIEIIGFKTDNMKTIKDRKTVTKIAKDLNSLRGKQANKDTNGEIANYINVYFTSGNKISFVKTGLTIRVNNIYYNINSRHSRMIDEIIEKFGR
ncbi:MAG: hypothetical protein QP753_01450 [Peptoniphilus harei]|uniref:Uncharacterized protein n=3 Tax=Peptoniphilus TaxID=162289 RepID=E4KWX4_9FIRM|nr:MULTISPECIES: hypothetical protein [Peptoniphilus]EFR33670.1 conserved hypothetical protein [Peptoniphilus harei ACS-146-V-Sch2b]KXA30870.1 hypothetical protein HMPREF3229_00735 [Peptoniphilus harei]MDK7354387.1 hypothetical protein [Peptoniphilus harei]MDK7369984.1 hypothetical protein [Peptoniphilus harei]MDK7376969.1 hypothetical protein [Peptoniphilus harei]